MMNGKLPESLKAAEEAVNLFKTAGDQFNEAASLAIMAEVHLIQNDFPKARELAEEGVWLMQQIPDAEGEDFCWECVEKVERIEGEKLAAQRALEMQQQQQQWAAQQAQMGGQPMNLVPIQQDQWAAPADEGGGAS